MGRVFSDAHIQQQGAETARLALAAAAYPDHCSIQDQMIMLVTSLHHYANAHGMGATDWAELLEEAQDTYHADGGNDDGFFVGPLGVAGDEASAGEDG